jgi:hypothetical protein
MQGLSSYSGTSSFLYKITADSNTSFELTALNSERLSTGFFSLDSIVAKFSNFESALYAYSHIPTQLNFISVGFSMYLAAWGLESIWTENLKVQLLTHTQSAVLNSKHVFSQVGLTYDSFNSQIQGLSWIFESVDIFLLGFELICAVFLFSQIATVKGRLQKQLLGYDDIVTFCQLRGVSVTEIFGLLTFALGFVFFDMFVSLAEDDSLEALSYVFASVIICAVVLLFLAADVQFYFLISSISGGELTLRILYTDIVNNALCLLRVFFCWIRYIFYDLQAELVDLAFHYTELGDEATLEAFPTIDSVENSQLWALLSNITGMLLIVFLDLVSIIFQILIGAFKLLLALFLFWLILDLFLLRTTAHSEMGGFLSTLKARSNR